jgi:DNA excision repair protein ERCC-5
MGVKDLWQLLSPVGRRVSIETLQGKTLAIDVSIWITQFIKSMRDEDGKMMKNAHIIGTLRRILKLLFHRVRPLFVFDGATPSLKLRTISARRKTHDIHVSLVMLDYCSNFLMMHLSRTRLNKFQFKEFYLLN